MTTLQKQAGNGQVVVKTLHRKPCVQHVNTYKCIAKCYRLLKNVYQTVQQLYCKFVLKVLTEKWLVETMSTRSRIDAIFVETISNRHSFDQPFLTSQLLQYRILRVDLLYAWFSNFRLCRSLYSSVVH
jgi:hypothetical protein